MTDFAADLDELTRRLRTASADAEPADRGILLQHLETAYEELRTAEEEVTSQQAQIASLMRGYDALQAHYERMLSLLPVPIVATDEHGTIKIANLAAADLLGMSLGRMVGKPALALVAADDHRELRSALTSPGLSQAPARQTITMVPRAGEPFSVEVTLSSTPDRRGSVTWMLLPEGAVEKASVLRTLPETVARLSILAASACDVRSALATSAQIVAEALGEDVHVSIVTGSPAAPDAVASSSKLAQQLDGVQLAAGEGPRLTAYETATWVESEELRTDDRWPRLGGRVPAEIGAVAVPLTYGGPLIGVLAVYCRSSCLEPGFVEPCVLVAETVTAVLYELEAKAELASVAEGLQQAMTSRAVIEQAKGVVMAQKGCDADRAFADLVEISSTQHVKLREVARQIVARAAGR